MKSKYEIIIYWSEDDDAFIAEVPELSGCMADGASYIEALESVKIIIDEWIETAQEYQNKGYAPAIIRALREKYPEMLIKGGRGKHGRDIIRS